MRLVPLDTLFDVEYGNQFDMNKMDTEHGSINFVSRSSQNLGVVAKVNEFQNKKPYPAGYITVTLGGTYLLSAFVQEAPFYTAQNIKVLKPKIEMSFEEKTFYCFAIGQNRFRYTSHGREANVTLDKLPVPLEVPEKFLSKTRLTLVDSTPLSSPALKDKVLLEPSKWEYFNLRDLFEVTASSDELIDNLTLGGVTPYVTSSDSHNGVTDFVEETATNPANTITANRGGSVGFFFYQPVPYKATPVDVRILNPKFDLNPYIGLFIKTVLQLEQKRYNYSRKMGTDRLNQIRIKLPSKNNEPNWGYMEKYIKSLPYSSSI